MSILKRIQPGESSSTGFGTSPLSNSSANTAAQPLKPRTGPIMGANQDTYQDLKNRVQTKLLAELDPNMDVSKTAQVRQVIQQLFEQILSEEGIVLSRPERSRLFDQITAEILGFGPLQQLLEEDSVTEIMVNGATHIYVERAGRIYRVQNSFESNEHVMRIIERIVSPLGRRIDESSPYVDARLAGWLPRKCGHSAHFIGRPGTDHP